MSDGWEEVSLSWYALCSRYCGADIQTYKRQLRAYDENEAKDRTVRGHYKPGIERPAEPVYWRGTLGEALQAAFDKQNVGASRV